MFDQRKAWTSNAETESGTVLKEFISPRRVELGRERQGQVQATVGWLALWWRWWRPCARQRSSLVLHEKTRVVRDDDESHKVSQLLRRRLALRYRQVLNSPAQEWRHSQAYMGGGMS